MSALIEELERAEVLGEHTWRLTDGAVVREIEDVTVTEARQRLLDLQALSDALGDIVVLPNQLVYEKKRLFYRREWVDGEPLKPIIDIDTTERILELMAGLPQSLVLYDLRPEHIIQTPDGLRLIDPGFKPAGTPPYAAPEQHGRGQITPAVGYYQLGATLLHLLTGTAPQDAMTLLIPSIEPPLIEQLPNSLAKRFRQLLEAKGKSRPQPVQLLAEFQSWQAFRNGSGEHKAVMRKGEHERTVWDERAEDSELIGDSLTHAVRAQADALSNKCRAGLADWWEKHYYALTMFGAPLVLSATLGVFLWSQSDNIAKALHLNTGKGEQTETIDMRFPANKPLPKSWTSNIDGSRMILIPAGPFYEGPSPEAGVGAEPIMTTLPAFYIDRYEVTNRQYQKFVEATGYQSEGTWRKYATPERMNHPVICVSWHDAQAYAKWAGKRLPTAEEWEKAARGGDARRFPWGNSWDPSRCNSFESNRGNTAPVGSYPNGASPYGVEDMVGNVWEWVDSWYIPADSTGSLPLLRQCRGGSRGDKAADCLIVAERGVFPENGRLVNSGFRCVVDPQHPDAMGDSDFVQLRSLPQGTGYERSHLPQAVAEQAKPKADAQPKELEGAYPEGYDSDGYDGYGGYNGGYGNYGGYGSYGSYGSYGEYSGGYDDPYAGAPSNEGRYDSGFGEQAPSSATWPPVYGDDSYGSSSGSSFPPPVPETKMNMSSQYTAADDSELTGDF